METWIRYWAKLVAIAGTCLVILAGLALRVSLPTLVIRGLVVGLVLHFALVIMGRLVGQALLRLAVEEQMRRAEQAEEQWAKDVELPVGRGAVGLPARESPAERPSETGKAEAPAAQDVAAAQGAGKEAA